MYVEQFRYSADNLGYLVYSDKEGTAAEGIAIDGGDASGIIEFARKSDIRIKYVTNTHFHPDHVTGNQTLLDETGADFFDCRTVTDDRTIDLGGEKLLVFPTPGHTMDSVTFAGDGFLVTGDTLFNGTVGNCFSGDLGAFFNSLKRIMTWPPETLIFAGHDYVDESMKYASIIEKNNPEIDVFLERYNPDRVVSTLDDELKVNPYIRFNAPEMIRILKERDVWSDSEQARFEAVMELY